VKPRRQGLLIPRPEKIQFFGKLVDVKKMAGVGFFLCGYSILALAVARIDPETYSRICSGQI
jgi:hypothetical protein